MPRYTTSRQKACASCSTAKTKCDRKPGQCTRCTLRGFLCNYPVGKTPEISAEDTENNGNIPVVNAVPPAHSPPALISTLVAGASHSEPNQDTSNLPMAFCDLSSSIATDLYCPINADAIQNRWINSFLAESGLHLKHYSTATTAFIYRMLNSYVGVMIRGHGTPPFIHTTQVMAIHTMPALATCLTLLRMCYKPLPGSESFVAESIQKEMGKIYERHSEYDEVALFAAFQVYLVYTMVLFFRLNDNSQSYRRQAMINLQTIACASSRGGLVCVAERMNTRPRWEAWIIAEAKRRTLYTMYLFDSLLSAEEGLPTPIGIELKGLPGPANHQLWKAYARQEWESVYNLDRRDWVQVFCIDELWPVPVNLDESERLVKRSRVDKWLEDVDEFGTMLYAVTCSTHGT